MREVSIHPSHFYLGVWYANVVGGRITISKKGFGYPLRVHQFAFHEPQVEVLVFDLDFPIETFIPLSFSFEDGINVSVVEKVPSRGLIPLLIQPLCNLAISHTSIVEVQDGVVKELLVFGIGCDEKVPCLENHLKTEIDINVIWGRI